MPGRLAISQDEDMYDPDSHKQAMAKFSTHRGSWTDSQPPPLTLRPAHILTTEVESFRVFKSPN